MPGPSKADKEADARREQELLAELEIYGSTDPNSSGDKLSIPERWWREHYHWLKDNGYLLRSRYDPAWIPSWQGTNKDWFKCEDSLVAKYASRVLDGTRLSDGAYVVLKLLNLTEHPQEVDIARFLCSPPLAANAANHCLPVYDVLSVSDDEKSVIIIMPLLQEYTLPPFDTIGEAVECFRQLFEGLQFMHQHRVAHRDCMSANIMMDPGLYIDAFHPASLSMKRDFSGYARFRTRTQRPPKYFLIDFGLSRRYDISVVQPMEVPIWGGDKQVPEFQNSNAPRDPFPTDVFYLGNAIRNDFVEQGFDFMRPLIAHMVQKEPSRRPTMDEVVRRFDGIRAGLSSWKLRSRVIDREETIFDSVVRGTSHWVRRAKFVARRTPAIPTPSS